MAFIRKDIRKGLSLPGLIDIIFLLLIFSLVTLSISHTNVESETEGEQLVKMDLPQTKSKAAEDVNDVLQTLMFEIDYLDSEDKEGSKVVYVLQPSVYENVTIEDAKEIAVRDSAYRVLPDNFLSLNDVAFARLPACQLISDAIHAYKKNHFFVPSLTNSIEIRAVKETEFRIFNYILDQCSVYGDTIPRVVTRTLTEVR